MYLYNILLPMSNGGYAYLSLYLLRHANICVLQSLIIFYNEENFPNFLEKLIFGPKNSQFLTIFFSKL